MPISLTLDEVESERYSSGRPCGISRLSFNLRIQSISSSDCELYRRQIGIPLTELSQILILVRSTRISIACLLIFEGIPRGKARRPCISMGEIVSKIVANMQARIGSYLEVSGFDPPFSGRTLKSPTDLN